MQYNLFPKEYEQKIIDKTYDDIVSEHRDHYEKQRRYRERWVDSSVVINGGVILTIVSGVVGCSVACRNTGEIITSLTTGVVSIIVSFLITVTLSVIISSKGESLIKKDEITYQKWCEKQQKESNMKVQDYNVRFENEAQKLCSKFFDSPMTEEIVDKMKGYVERNFSNADRNSYVEQITVDLSCRVYKNKVEWVYGNDVENYNFVVNRCAILKNPLEQAALARAIARKLQNYVKQRYSVDVQGTKSVIEVRISELPNYKTKICDYSSIEIKYKAPNKYYMKARLW